MSWYLKTSAVRFFLICLMSSVALLGGCGGKSGSGGGNSMPPPKSNFISVVPAGVSMPVNATINLSAIMNYIDGTTADVTSQVSWTSAAPGVGVGTYTGLVTGASAGSAVVVTATLNGLTASSDILVAALNGATNLNLFNARYDHTASLLASGQVIVVGGYGNIVSGSNLLHALGSVELYDPTSAKWTETIPLNTARGDHASVKLPDGRVLVAGGTDATSLVLSSSELFDPATSIWTLTGNLNDPRAYNSITLLANGNVLLAGGYDNSGRTNAAEIYTPAASPSSAGTWALTGSLITARDTHTATLLATGPNTGKVLVVGGYSPVELSSCELFDPSKGAWSNATSLSSGPRAAHTATLLPNGQVLVVGGTSPNPAVLNTSELYDPLTNTWHQTGNLYVARWGHTATLLGNGQVLVQGGLDINGNPLTSFELYDPNTQLWTLVTTSSTITSFVNPRDNFTSTLLNTGHVLSAGGNGTTSAGVLSSTELY